MAANRPFFFSFFGSAFWASSDFCSSDAFARMGSGSGAGAAPETGARMMAPVSSPRSARASEGDATGAGAASGVGSVPFDGSREDELACVCVASRAAATRSAKERLSSSQSGPFFVGGDAGGSTEASCSAPAFSASVAAEETSASSAVSGSVPRDSESAARRSSADAFARGGAPRMLVSYSVSTASSSSMAANRPFFFPFFGSGGDAAAAESSVATSESSSRVSGSSFFVAVMMALVSTALSARTSDPLLSSPHRHASSSGAQ